MLIKIKKKWFNYFGVRLFTSDCVTSKVILSYLKGDDSPMLTLWLEPSYDACAPFGVTLQPRSQIELVSVWICVSKLLIIFLTPKDAQRNESDLHKSWNLTMCDFTPTKGTPAWSTAIYQPFIC